MRGPLWWITITLIQLRGTVVFGCFCLANEKGNIPKQIGDFYVRAWILAQIDHPVDNEAYNCYETRIDEVYASATPLVSISTSTVPLCTRKHEHLCGVMFQLDTPYSISGYVGHTDDLFYTSLCDYYHDQIESNPLAKYH